MVSKVTVFSILCSIVLALVCLGCVVVSGFGNLIWICFTTYGVISCMQGNFKKFHWYLIAIALGWVWAFGYLYVMQWMMAGLGMSLPLAMFVDVVIVTFIAIMVHMLPLGKTPLNITMLPLCYTPVMALFGTMGQSVSIVNVIIAEIVGIIVACLTPIFFAISFKPEKENIQANSSTPA
jgi:hypothetical protein